MCVGSRRSIYLNLGNVEPFSQKSIFSQKPSQCNDKEINEEENSEDKTKLNNDSKLTKYEEIKKIDENINFLTRKSRKHDLTDEIQGKNIVNSGAKEYKDSQRTIQVKKIDSEIHTDSCPSNHDTDSIQSIEKKVIRKDRGFRKSITADDYNTIHNQLEQPYRTSRKSSMYSYRPITIPIPVNMVESNNIEEFKDKPQSPKAAEVINKSELECKISHQTFAEVVNDQPKVPAQNENNSVIEEKNQDHIEKIEETLSK